MSAWAPLLALGGGLVGTWAAREIARRLGIVAPPNPIVPQHTRPVAYLGGLGIAAGLALALPDVSRPSVSLLVGGALMLVLGAVDDLVRLRPLPKLLGQGAAGAVAVALGLIAPFTGIWPLDAAISLFLVLTWVNAVNFTDVCDGLVGGLAAAALVGTALLPGTSAMPVLAAAASVGFLFFNRPPASVYLGDAGAHLLGFLLIGEGLLSFASDPEPRIAVGVVSISGVFLFELVFITAVRLRKGIPFWKGSPDHFSLRMQAGPFTRGQTVLLSWTAGCLCASAGVWIALGPAVPALVIGTTMLLCAALAASMLLRWEVRPKRTFS